MKKLLLLLPALLLAACSTQHGFDRGALRQQMNAGPAITTDADIRKVLETRPQLGKPFRLAVYFMPRTGWYSDAWSWQAKDKEQVVAAGDKLKAAGIVSDMYVLPQMLVTDPDKKSIRLAAAQSGADAVLIVHGLSSVNVHNNWKAWSYVALLPALFVPGTQYDGLFMSTANLWDVRNDYLYLSVESEGTAKQVSAPALSDREALVREAKTDALGGIRQQVEARLEAMGRG